MALKAAGGDLASCPFTHLFIRRLPILFTEANIKKYNLVLTKSGNFRGTLPKNSYHYNYACENCGYPFLYAKKGGKFCGHRCSKIGKNNPNFCKTGKSHQKFGVLNSNWKNGVTAKNIPLYDTYAPQLEPMERCVHDPEDPNILNVFCIYCGKQFRPTRQRVQYRIKGINGNDTYKFYCCDECKTQCPIFWQKKYSKEHKPNNNRPLQKEWASLVLEQNNNEYICEICGEYGSIAHHIDPVVCNPIESADADNGIIVCDRCHNSVHQISGCTISNLILNGKNKSAIAQSIALQHVQ